MVKPSAPIFGAVALAVSVNASPAIAQQAAGAPPVDTTSSAAVPTAPPNAGLSEVPPAPPPVTAPPVGNSGPIPDTPPIENPSDSLSAGYRNGTFYIRSPDDVFRLYIQGRAHADWLDQVGPGTSSLPPGSGVNDGFYLRRARLTLAGEFFQVWQWMVEGELASGTTIDNAAATQATPTCTVAANSFLNCANARQNPVDNAVVKPIPTDVFVNFGPSPWANLQAGQFYLPFTLENRISDNTTPFLERSLAVRNLGAPLQRDIGVMFWGESPDRSIYYAAAVLNGDGPNRVNVDSRYDFAGRVVMRPFAATSASATKFAQIGASARAGSRDPAYVGYDLPNLTTQGGFPFWKPTYKDAFGRTMHIIPSSSQWGVAGDVYLPVDKFDFTGEFMYVSDDTREAVDGLQLSPFTERLGDLKGYGWYAQISYWILGDHDIGGYPSYGRPIHVDLKQPQKPPQHGVQALAKLEQLHLSYAGSSRGGVDDKNTPNGNINVQTVEVGLNYWATKHLRVGINYVLDMVPDSAPVTPSTAGGPQQSSTQRAVTPGQLLAKGVDDSARDSGHVLHEVQARVGVQF